jgi:PAS domain S-box-containing protein
MDDSDRPREQLLDELAELRRRVSELEAAAAEHRQVEEALKEIGHRFRSLIERTSDAVFCYEFDSPIPIDLPIEEQVRRMYDCTLVECNDICARSYGDYRAEDVIGRKLTDLFGTTAESLDNLFTAVVRGGYQIVDGSGVEEMPDGGKRYFLNSGYGVVEDGRLLRMWGTFREVTEQKRTEEIQSVLFDIARATAESRDLEELLKTIHERIGTLIDTTNFFVALYDEENDLYTFPYWVDAEDSDFGPQSLRGSLTDYVRRVGTPLLIDEDRHKQLVQEGEVAVVGPPSRIWLGAPLKTTHGIFGVVVVQSYTEKSLYTARDLELVSYVSEHIAWAIERKRMAEALLEREERLRALVGNLTEGIAIIDAEGNEIGNIPTLGPDTGYTPEERFGKSMFELIHPDDVRQVKESLARVLEQPGKSVLEEARIQHKDGSWRVFEAVASNLLDNPAIRGIVITSRDITERKRAEEALKRRDAILKAVNSAAESFLQTPDWRQAIDGILERIGEATGVDRVAIFERDVDQEDTIQASLRYEWVAEGVTAYINDPRFHFIDVVQAGYGRELPLWRQGKVTHGQARESRTGEHLLQQIWGTLSGANVPILVREELWGIIIFSMVTVEREWEEEEIEALQIAASMLGTAIERHEAEEALRESEGLWRNLVETMPQGFGMRDENSVSTYANATFCQMLGYRPEEIIGHNLDDFLSEASRIQLREQLNKQKEGRPSNYELVWIAKDGHEVPTIVSPRPILDTDGDFKGSFAVITDITELKRAEEAQQRYAARLRALREIDQAILEAESSDAIIQVTLQHIRELIPGERVSVGLFNFETQERGVVAVDADDQAAVEQGIPHRHPLDPRWVDVLNRGEPFVIEDIRTFPEPLPALQDMVDRGFLSLATAPLIAEGELIGSLNLMAKEVSAFSKEHLEIASQVADQLAIAIQQARLHEQVQRHAAELEARVAERTAELRTANEELHALTLIKDEFVSNVSHELRTPITNIKLHLHLLTARPGKRDKYMATLERETLRLENLVENLLYVSRLDQNRIDFTLIRLDLNKLIETYIADRTPVARDRGLTLTLEAARKLPPIQADPGQLGQVISVLLTNAINYTPEGGRVTVSTHGHRFEEEQWAGFSVSDTGPGIPSEEQERLFERFFRGQAGRKSGTPGTGLGLAIAREIVERHGGRIEVASAGEDGNGTMFTVWLPSRAE